MKKTKMNTLKMVELAVLMALVAVLQITGTGVNITGTPISLVLIPIVLGAMLLGPAAGALLGLEFGIIVYVAGFVGVDAFTFILIQDHPIYTALICVGKGVLAGLGAGFVYRLVAAKNQIAAVFAAAAATPIINTALFILGALGMQSTLSSNFLGEGETVIYFLVVVCAGINFLLELALNLIAAPAIFRLYQAFAKRLSRK